VNAQRLLERYHGVRGIGVLERVEDGQMADFLKKARLRITPDFTVKRVDQQHAQPALPFHFIVTMVEPMGKNKQALGLDVTSEKNRLDAALEAASTGNPIMTKRIVLVQDKARRNGFDLFVPLYQPGAPLKSDEDRRKFLRGFIYAPFVAEKFFKGVLDHKDRQIEVDVFEGNSTRADHLLYSSQRASRPRVISVTSATHGEGRTFVACNLATVLAQSGSKVLLVDADRVNPRVHEIFGVSNESGFTELILQQSGRAGGTATDTVWSTGMPNLFVSPGGQGMARLATLTRDPRMPAVLDRLCSHFDIILIDTPPVFSDGDALAIGQQADGVLLVVRPGQAPVELFEASVEQCLQHGLPVIGKIVNGNEPSLQSLAS